MSEVRYEVSVMLDRMRKLEEEVAFLYHHLNLSYERDDKDKPVLDLIASGNTKDAVIMHRQVHDCGLAEANEAVKQLKETSGF